MTRLVALATAHSEDLIHEANIIAMNLMRIDAHNGAYTGQLMRTMKF
jgi:hypothetical protein